MRGCWEVGHLSRVQILVWYLCYATAPTADLNKHCKLQKKIPTNYKVTWQQEEKLLKRFWVQVTFVIINTKIKMEYQYQYWYWKCFTIFSLPSACSIFCDFNKKRDDKCDKHSWQWESRKSNWSNRREQKKKVEMILHSDEKRNLVQILNYDKEKIKFFAEVKGKFFQRKEKKWKNDEKFFSI